jgi:hypothetical protein
MGEKCMSTSFDKIIWAFQPTLQMAN